ncbi:MAG: DUF2752 domain-containing protein [Planctomycetales bacterium]
MKDAETLHESADSSLASDSSEDWPDWPERPPTVTPHCVWLGLCAATLVASMMLGIQGRERVTLPFLGFPLPELCMMKRTTGVPCPGCGLTRSFISLASGRFEDAWSYNPAGMLLFAAMLFQFPFQSVQIWRIRRDLPPLKWPLPNAFMMVTAVALFVQWLAKWWWS